MDWSPIPPLVAAVVAVAMAVSRRLVPILLETSIGVPSPRALAALTFGGGFVSFVLVYGALLGAAFAVGRRRASTAGERVTVLVTGVAGALAYVAASGVILLVGDSPRSLVAAVGGLGGGLAVGVQLAVVVFAGLALAERT